MEKKSLKILIVEDEKSMSKVLELKMAKEGFETKTAQNGEEALLMLANEKFDLILLDIVMPRVDGFSVLKEMAKRGDLTPVIVSTNLGQVEDVARASSLGVKDYFIKSDTPIAEVINRIKGLNSK